MSYTKTLPSSQAVAKTLPFSGFTVIPYTASSCRNTSKVSPLKIKAKRSTVKIIFIRILGIGKKDLSLFIYSNFFKQVA